MKLRWVLCGGFIAGVLDISYAAAFWRIKANVPPTRILQSVAAGLLGRASFEGGAATAALGLTLHFFIAICMSFAYFLTAQQWHSLVRRPFVFGSAYGLALYAVMNFVVVPLSAAMPASKDPVWIVLSVLVHAFCVGVPIAVCARRALAANPR